jgi:hypothetical protein
MNKGNSPINQKDIEEKLQSVDNYSEIKNNRIQSSVLDEQWLSLTQDWQTQPFEKTDIQALLKRTKIRTLWAKLILALDVVATLGMFFAFFLGLYQGDWKSATITYVGVGGLLSAIFVYYEVKIRQQTWQHSCDSPDKAITNAIEGCKSSIKYVLLIKYSTWLVLPLVNVYVFAIVSESGKSPWPAFFGVNLFVIAIWGTSHFFHLKRKKELKQLVSL